MKINNIQKSIATVASVMLLSSVAHGAFSLSVSAVSGAGNGVLTNLQSSTGNATDRRVWGLLVDEGNDGFSIGNYLFGASLGFSTVSTLQIDVGGVATDTNDKLYIATALMVNTNSATIDGGTVGGLARPTAFNGISTPNGSLGDPYYIIWFDETAATGNTVLGGNYGVYRETDFTVPADGNVININSKFLGADPVRLANREWAGIEVIPETSTSLLGALGALALLRRRRN